jgi:hypothetical protein
VSASAAAQARASTAQLLTQQLATTDQLVQADKAVSDARTSLPHSEQGAGSRPILSWRRLRASSQPSPLPKATVPLRVQQS